MTLMIHIMLSASTCSRCINGLCINSQCACNVGWSGSACDQPIDECSRAGIICK
ncbi:hypothetical protein GBAR_LOCUS17279 [Geodia barretti]|uniref:EGF-like domain-containing protein n=1 Tax=Geodia barretti TaxID=519541 RepID=A0AA35SJT0_GEOBA|nr:hypothetical protein GBAR_LOCUS17279 [Geodia barretti]